MPKRINNAPRPEVKAWRKRAYDALSGVDESSGNSVTACKVS